MNNPKDIVRAGYNKVSFAYREDNPGKDSETYQTYKVWIDELSGLLDEKDHVLDLGCGCGIPTTKLLAQRFRVTGVDISDVQIERARKLVPNASFVCGDMCEMNFSSREFDAIVCLYAIIHVPLGEQQKLIGKMWEWLKPEGYLMLTTGHTEWTGEESNWLGVEGGNMYWSHADRETYLQWLENAGFNVCWERFVPEGNSGHTLILSRKKIDC